MKVRGFTLVEMVLTMVVGSILILGIAGFVELGSRGYADAVDRQRIQTQSRFVLEKMMREIRHAVPNSFSTVDDCISFYPMVYTGFYSITGASNDTLSFVIGNSSAGNLNGLKMIINPTNYTDFNSGINLTSNNSTITLGAPLSSQSIANRFYIYRDKVSYCLNFTSQQITRSINGANETQVADSVSAGAFSYAPPTLQRGGVVHLALTFTQSGESSSFETDVQVLNVP